MQCQIMHIRHHQRRRCTKLVTCCNQILSYTDNYKYLGYYLNEFLSHNKTIEMLNASAQRSFGRVVNIFKSLKNMGIKTFETLYSSYVTPIANYSSAIWGFKESHENQVLQNRVARYYLGVNKFTPVAATSLEMDWLDPKFNRWIEIVRYHNRLVEMKPNRLPVRIYNWEKSLNVQGWVKDCEFILNYCNMGDYSGIENVCDLDVLYSRLKKLNRDKWWLDAHGKSKLRTYIRIHDTENVQSIVKRNMPRSQRSFISKFKCGVLPIALETGRWTDVKEEKRLCIICPGKHVETEDHFLTVCPALKHTRDLNFGRLNAIRDISSKKGIDKMKEMFKPDLIKATARMIEEMFDTRKSLMYEATKNGNPTVAVDVDELDDNDVTDGDSAESDSNSED